MSFSNLLLYKGNIYFRIPLQRYKILWFPLYRGTKKIEKIFLLQKNKGLKRANPILVEAIARRMREIREQNGHTQEYLAHNTHLKIWDYESMQKSPSLESIARFCTFYALSLSDFFAPITFPQDLKWQYIQKCFVAIWLKANNRYLCRIRLV